MVAGPTEYQPELVKAVYRSTDTQPPSTSSPLYTIQHIKDNQANIDRTMSGWVQQSHPYNPYQ